MNLKISVITVSYNSSSTIEDTLKSVLSQTYQNVESVIVDGASTDNTIDIIRAYESKFEGRLLYISEADKGIYDAMNKGIQMATGEVIGFLNSDDYYTSKDILRNVAMEMNQPNIDAVYGDVHYVNAANLDKCTRYYSSRIFCRNLMRFGLMPAHPSFYCLREVYIKFGTFNTSYKVAADFENLLRLIFVNRIRTKYIPIDFVTMRTGGASTSGLVSYKQIMNDHLRALRSNNVYSNPFILCLRYIYKLWEIFNTKVSGDSALKVRTSRKYNHGH